MSYMAAHGSDNALPALDPDLVEFCRRGYAPYDDSHNLDHAIQVYTNAGHIVRDCLNVLNPGHLYAVRDTTMLHDIDDYKYRDIQAVTHAEIERFVHGRHSPLWAGRIMWTIDNMSWSKQKAVDYASPLYHAGLFHVARDADWIEAIDVKRCIAYQKSRGHDERAARVHVNEKLLHIRDRLHWDTSKLLAQPKHDTLVQWCDTEGRQYE